MADEVYRQRKKITTDDLGATEESPKQPQNDPLSQIKNMQEAIAKETGREVNQTFGRTESPFEISGNIPAEFRQVMAGKSQPQTPPQSQPQSPSTSDEEFEVFEAPPERARKPKTTGDAKLRLQGSDHLEALLSKLAEQHQWEEFAFPSGSKFYQNIPERINIRPMTGEEEQILATPRFVRRGKAIDMIFQRCIKENIPTEELLSIDRTHLLIYLRGISYTPEYDVEIKCPSCSTKYATVIDLNSLEVNMCPQSFGPDSLEGNLPTTGFSYRYRLATGADEQEISTYRERRIQQWGDQSEDDTLLYRTALLLEEIEGVSLKKELTLLMKRLPINDVAYLRNTINNPPFGVDTKVPEMCPQCSEEFHVDLPLETNFFFPRRREERTQA